MIFKFLSVLLLIVSVSFSQALAPKREFRGIWIASVSNIDWPVSKYQTTAQQRTDFINIINKHKAMGINAIFIQIRPSCDAFYSIGSVEPWSEYLMGTQGSAPLPFYDPLLFIVDECHKRNIEVHCWFNPYRSVVSSGSSVSPNHISVKKPEWHLRFGTPYKLIDPGIPDARNYVANVVMNVVKNYDIDGVHFDDYFYPYEGITTQDSASQRLYKPSGMSLGDWRRDNVNKLIYMIYDSIQVYKPWVKHGMGPFGIWKSGTPPGITGLNAYDAIYCDPVAWLNAKKIDYVQPQLYWKIGSSGQDYLKLMPWWSTVTNGRHLYTGNAAHNLSNSEAWPASEILSQIRFNRMNTKAHGETFFSSKVMTNNSKGIYDSLRKDLYKYPALPPTMPWKDSIAPLSPTNVIISGDSLRIRLEWTKPGPAPDNGMAKYFIIYRGINTLPNSNDPSNIRFITNKDTNIYIDTVKLTSTDIYYYQITALDRLHNESVPSQLVSFSLSGIEQEPGMKFKYTLSQNYPNPFNPQTTIKYELEKPGQVKLVLYDVLGKEVSVLQDEYKNAGNHIFELNMSKLSLPSGMYIYQLQSNDFISIKKMMYLK